MNVTTFAVVSDLHCRLSTDANDSFLEVGSLRLPEGRHPHQALLDLIASAGLSADALLVPGDLTNKCRREGLSQSWDFVLEMAKSFGTEIVLPVIGNHDVDSRKSIPGQDAFYNVRNLRPHFPFQDENARRQFFSDGFCLLPVGASTEVIAVNTVIDHTDEASAKRGGFDIARIDALRKFLDTQTRRPIRIAMMHHHPILHTAPFLFDLDVIATGDELVATLKEAGCEFIVHGHRHVPRLTMHNNVAVLSAGSFAANLGIYASAVSNMFHIVRLEESGGHVRGTIRTWVYRHGEGWATAHHNHSGFPFSTGFDSHCTLAAVKQELLNLAARERSREMLDSKLLDNAVPQLKFMTPSDFQQLQKDLILKGLKLMDPDESGELMLWRKLSQP